jgi:spermidine synthase
LVHGNTFHGRQSLAHREEPLAYYHRTGPMGQVFAAFAGARPLPEVAVVGLGAGSLAAYAESGQRWTYYEIDPTVVRIARDPRYFTFLQDCRAPLEDVLGDARLTLHQAQERRYDLLIIDAFSSDAIPLHLLTREALHLYLAKLKPDGILAFNISNRYLDLEPVLAALARDANLVCLTQQDLELSEAEKNEGKSPSQWVVMARRKQDLGKLAQDGRWREAKGRRDLAVWTDDFSNLFRVFQWR